MILFRRNRVKTEETTGCATLENSRRIFTDGMDELYQLSFLLTATDDKAEQCFVAGLKESLRSNRVFKEWARSWAKRVIIQDAIRELKPCPPVASSSFSVVPYSTGELPNQDQHFNLDRGLGLADFDRFVFVISVLGHYSNRDCAMLLGCSSRQVVEARVRGFEQFNAPLLMMAEIP
jgi:hypothetical protein